tara:strand:- start:122 stop:262 length:141 start_codon:yes stop_codon:yes gene_type:complete
MMELLNWWVTDGWHFLAGLTLLTLATLATLVVGAIVLPLLLSWWSE